MAKGNQKKRNSNGYFQRNAQQNGPNFMMKKTAKDIRHDFRNIFRDIAHSDPERDIPDLVDYFNNLTFVSNLVASANQEYQIANATFIGLKTYLDMAQRGEVYLDPNSGIYEQMMVSQNQSAAFCIIAFHLNNILSLFNYSADDDWLRVNIEGQLKSLSLQLARYKRII